MPANDKKPATITTDDHTQPKPAAQVIGAGEARLPHEGLRQADGTVEGRDVFDPKDKGENFVEGSQEDLAARQLAGEGSSATPKGPFQVVSAIQYYPPGADLSDPHKLPSPKHARPGSVVSDLSPKDAARFFATGAIKKAEKKSA